LTVTCARTSDVDNDGDGVGSIDDACAGTPSQTPVAADGCPDSDGDGVSVYAGDNCSATWNPDQADTDGDAVGDSCDPDVDGDGIENSVDQCPATPTGTVVTSNGCPPTPPVAVADSYTVVGGATRSVSAPGVLANDTDANHDPLTAQLDTTTTHGSLTLNANGSFTYTPGEDTVGTDTFTYHANDGTANSNIVTVTITVQAGCDGRRATQIGTAGKDVLGGTGGNDVIVGLGGNDVIEPGSGVDIVCGGSGNDSVRAGSGDDVVFGGSGDDTLDGGSDNDRLFGEAGIDQLFGGGDNDALDGGTGTPDRCDGEGGTDTATASCELAARVP
jgi:VCBS repeat-containing protein